VENAGELSSKKEKREGAGDREDHREFFGKVPPGGEGKTGKSKPKAKGSRIKKSSLVSESKEQIRAGKIRNKKIAGNAKAAKKKHQHSARNMKTDRGNF